MRDGQKQALRELTPSYSNRRALEFVCESFIASIGDETIDPGHFLRLLGDHYPDVLKHLHDFALGALRSKSAEKRKLGTRVVAQIQYDLASIHGGRKLHDELMLCLCTAVMQDDCQDVRITAAAILNDKLVRGKTLGHEIYTALMAARTDSSERVRYYANKGLRDMPEDRLHDVR